MCNGNVRCAACSQHQLKANLLAGEARLVKYEGRNTLVVPVVMARADVPMNDALVPAAELVPYAWNGVPVTVGHPAAPDGGPLAANSPDVLTEYSVGRIFGARVVNGVLKGEAWIDIERANNVRPGLVADLRNGVNMDVSTGYFCDTDENAGEVNGKKYNAIHRNLRPEHLALLPDEEGACSFEAGCGVRANSKGKIEMKLNDAMAAFRQATKSLQDTVNSALHTNKGKKPKKAVNKGKRSKQAANRGKVRRNERGDDNDPRMMVADLLSDDRSPFTADDEEALRYMSADTLAKMRSAYLSEEDPEENEDDPPAEENEDDPPAEENEDDDLEENEDDDPPAEENEEDDPPAEGNRGKKRNRKHMRRNTASRRNDQGLAALVQNMAVAVDKLAKANALSPEDREALTELRRNRANQRKEMEARVVANSRVTKAEAEGLDFGTLKTVHDALLPVANFAGRATPKVNHADIKDEAVASMVTNSGGSVALLSERRKANKAA